MIPSKNLSEEAKRLIKGLLGVELKTSDEAIENEKVKAFIS